MNTKGFKHLTYTKRLQLEAFRRAKIPVIEIARNLGVCRSTIYNELKRGHYMHLNSDKWIEEPRYSPELAEEKYRSHLKDKGGELKIGNDYALVDFIEDKIINERYSPQAVLGYIKDNDLNFNTTIKSKNTIYSYIRKGVFYSLEMKNLPLYKTHKRKREKVGKRPPKGKSIEQRPKEISKRVTFGNWEMDCVCGSTRSALLTFVERMTRMTFVVLLPNKMTETVVKTLDNLERTFGTDFSKIFKSITVDNGVEFSDVKGMERSINGKDKRTQFYYCHPYCSCERGTNERLNREIRRWLPKGTNFEDYTQEEINRVARWVNDYPREIFNFKSSRKVFDKQLSILNLRLTM